MSHSARFSMTDEDTGPSPYREPRALRVQRAGVEDLVVPLSPERTYVFGRAPDSTVVFSHDAVSRQHGRLLCREDQRWVYRDLDSTNGSFLGRDGVEPGEEEDLRRLFLKMQASRDWVLEAGTCLLLGNGQSRVTLLAELPQGLAETPPRPGLAQQLTAGDPVRLPTLEERPEDLPPRVDTARPPLGDEQEEPARTRQVRAIVDPG